MGSPIRPLSVPDLLNGSFDAASDAGRYITRGLAAVARPVVRASPFGQFMDPEPIDTTPAPAAPPPVASPSWAKRYPTTPVDQAQRVPSGAAPEPEPAPAAGPRGQSDDTLRGIGDRAYSFTADPWNPSGGARSAAQIVSDTNARALLDASYEPQIARNNRDAARVDPMTLMTQGRAKTLAYESLLPAGTESRVRSSFEPGVPSIASDYAGDVPLYDAEEITPMGVSQGQMNDFERQLQIEAAKHQDPKAMLDVRMATARQRELDHIGAERERLLQSRVPPQEFDARMRAMIIDAAQRGAILEGDVRGLAALLYPKNDDSAILDTPRR